MLKLNLYAMLLTKPPSLPAGREGSAATGTEEQRSSDLRGGGCHALWGAGGAERRGGGSSSLALVDEREEADVQASTRQIEALS
jgi:hypothetical protein